MSGIGVHDAKFSKHQLKMFKKRETEKDPHHIMYRPRAYEIEVCENCGKKTLIFCLIMNLRKQKTLKTKCQPLAEIPIVSIFPCFFMSLYAQISKTAKVITLSKSWSIVSIC